MSQDKPRQALGLLETRGWVAAVEAADAMAKAARVRIARYDVTRDARVTIVVRGSLADVEAPWPRGNRPPPRLGRCFGDT